jgi:hypothetical protein
MPLIAPTRFVRATVETSFREVLDACELQCERHVNVILPEGPIVFMVLDTPPEVIGPNFSYKTPPFEGGKPIHFKLEPHQKIYAAAERGVVTFAIIVEHHEVRE